MCSIFMPGYLWWSSMIKGHARVSMHISPTHASPARMVASAHTQATRTGYCYCYWWCKPAHALRGSSEWLHEWRLADLCGRARVKLGLCGSCCFSWAFRGEMGPDGFKTSGSLLCCGRKGMAGYSRIFIDGSFLSEDVSSRWWSFWLPQEDVATCVEVYLLFNKTTSSQELKLDKYHKKHTIACPCGWETYPVNVRCSLREANLFFQVKLVKNVLHRYGTTVTVTVIILLAGDRFFFFRSGQLFFPQEFRPPCLQKRGVTECEARHLFFFFFKSSDLTPNGVFLLCSCHLRRVYLAVICVSKFTA
jgi:hypothetical protein